MFPRGLIASCLLVIGPGALGAQQVTGEIELETRGFPRDPLYNGQHHNNASLRFQPEFYMAWDGGRTTLTFEPFVRLDLADGQRTHLDIRDLSFVRAWSAIELRAGIGKVFWGVTESQHLVDVINQTDLVENLDGEDKLGQPMVNLSFIQPWGTVDLFVLPGFRDRTFAGEGGRLRFPLTVDGDQAVFESDAEQRHVDWAVRWSHALGSWDLGVSHFSGTNREPRLEPGMNLASEPVLVPHYDQTDQTGVDVQFTVDSWLWKFEGISRTGIDERLWAVTAGLEYTLYGVFDGLADVGLLAEYLWDSRDSSFAPPFNDDIAGGFRFAFNDTQSSQLLAFAVIDRGGRGSFVSVEGNRRVGDSWTVGIESRGFIGVQSSDPLYALRRDVYVGVTVTRYF